MAERFADFFKYCQMCKYVHLDEHEDPCNDCLSVPVNEDSRKPVRFKEEEK